MARAVHHESSSAQIVTSITALLPLNIDEYPNIFPFWTAPDVGNFKRSA